MDSSRTKLLLGLSASLVGTALVTIIIYKRFFSVRRTRKTGDKHIPEVQDDDSEVQISPPIEFKSLHVLNSKVAADAAEPPVDVQNGHAEVQVVENAYVQLASEKSVLLQGEQRQSEVIKNVPTVEEHSNAQENQCRTELVDDVITSSVEPINAEEKQCRAEVAVGATAIAEKPVDLQADQNQVELAKNVVASDKKPIHAGEEQNEFDAVNDMIETLAEEPLHEQPEQHQTDVVPIVAPSAPQPIHSQGAQHQVEVCEDVIVPAVGNHDVLASIKNWHQSDDISQPSLDSESNENCANSGGAASQHDITEVMLEVSPPVEFKCTESRNIAEPEIVLESNGADVPSLEQSVEEVIIPHVAGVESYSPVPLSNEGVQSSDSDDTNYDVTRSEAYASENLDVASKMESKLQKEESSTSLNNSHSVSVNGGTSVSDSGIELPNVNDGEKMSVEEETMISDGAPSQVG